MCLPRVESLKLLLILDKLDGLGSSRERVRGEFLLAVSSYDCVAGVSLTEVAPKRSGPFPVTFLVASCHLFKGLWRMV